MTTAAQSTLLMILIALGMIGVILSFMVPDRKKSTIALVLAGVIILGGVVQWGSQFISKAKFTRKVRQMQRDQRTDFEAMRERLKEQSKTNPTTKPPTQQNN